MICASEQSVIVVDAVYEAVKQEFCDRGAYFLNDEENEKLGHKIIVDGRLNAEIVGQSVEKLTKLAKFEQAVDKAEILIEFGGMGHTAKLYTAPSNKEHIKYYESKVETARVLINTPSSQGAIAPHTSFST